jgi:hypothetical protein
VKPLKIANALLAEHVVEGARGKHTLINVFTGDIRIRTLPAVFLVGAYIEMIPLPNQSSEFTVEFMVGNKMAGMAEGTFPPFEPDKPALVVIPSVPISVESDTILRIRVKSLGFRPTIAISKVVNLDPSV